MLENLVVEVLVCVIAFAFGEYIFGHYLFSAKSKKRGAARKQCGTVTRRASTAVPRSARVVADQRRCHGIKMATFSAHTHSCARDPRFSKDYSPHAVAGDPQCLQNISDAIEEENVKLAMGLLAQYVSERPDSNSSANVEQVSLELLKLACKQNALDSALTMLETKKMPLVPSMSEVLVTACINKNSCDLANRIMRLRSQCGLSIDIRAYSRLVLGLVEKDERNTQSGGSTGTPDSTPTSASTSSEPAAGITDIGKRGFNVSSTASGTSEDVVDSEEAAQAWAALFGPMFDAAAVAIVGGGPLPKTIDAVSERAPALGEAVSKMRRMSPRALEYHSSHTAVLASFAAAHAHQSHPKALLQASGKASTSATPGQPRVTSSFPPCSRAPLPTFPSLRGKQLSSSLQVASPRGHMRNAQASIRPRPTRLPKSQQLPQGREWGQ